MERHGHPSYIRFTFWLLDTVGVPLYGRCAKGRRGRNWKGGRSIISRSISYAWSEIKRYLLMLDFVARGVQTTINT